MSPVVTASVPAPWGPLRLASGPDGLVALDQLVPEEPFLERLDRRFGPSWRGRGPGTDRATTVLETALAALRAFLDGDLDVLAGLPVDLSDRPAWDVKVLTAVRGIPAGSTASYGDIARMVDRPGAARAVGGAVGRNPVGLVIPCHRVLAAGGRLGGYGAAWFGGPEVGLALKRRLLEREGVVPVNAG